jgi:hypothetical protein
VTVQSSQGHCDAEMVRYYAFPEEDRFPVPMFGRLMRGGVKNYTNVI